MTRRDCRRTLLIFRPFRAYNSGYCSFASDYNIIVTLPVNAGNAIRINNNNINNNDNRAESWSGPRETIVIIARGLSSRGFAISIKYVSADETTVGNDFFVSFFSVTRIPRTYCYYIASSPPTDSVRRVSTTIPWRFAGRQKTV